ncbi:hypothetical protein [Heliophilum fasciatum]|uniref:Uncharacterized protein n=1 Tax=Heliophilum fasciatum TaxID=35700 RepID=A0A4R2RCL6_9FIRM|nr:hypothetical protein [Heliophilum fasciatum]MCW2279417.1 hypothetical protein [Heliophilum fasciatum]TCP59988.1 hypothetical protein EDD73_1431 [Heliophilum fasciatum]
MKNTHNSYLQQQPQMFTTSEVAILLDIQTSKVIEIFFAHQPVFIEGKHYHYDQCGKNCRAVCSNYVWTTQGLCKLATFVDTMHALETWQTYYQQEWNDSDDVAALSTANNVPHRPTGITIHHIPSIRKERRVPANLDRIYRPHQKYIDEGYFAVINGVTMVSPKGVELIKQIMEKRRQSVH